MNEVKPGEKLKIGDNEYEVLIGLDSCNGCDLLKTDCWSTNKPSCKDIGESRFDLYDVIFKLVSHD